MKIYFQEKRKVVWILLLFITVVSFNAKGENSGLFGGSSSLYSIRQDVPERSGGFYKNQEADLGLYYMGDIYPSVRSSGTENTDDGGNASKLPIKDNLGVIVLCLLAYGAAKKVKDGKRLKPLPFRA